MTLTLSIEPIFVRDQKLYSADFLIRSGGSMDRPDLENIVARPRLNLQIPVVNLLAAKFHRYIFHNQTLNSRFYFYDATLFVFVCDVEDLSLILFVLHIA